MSPPVVGVQVAAVGIAIGLLALAAWRDVASRTIPDWISISLAGMGCAVRLQSGLLDLMLSVVMSVVLFSLLLIAFSRGVLGGGDVKLISALALWLAPPDCYGLVMVTAVAGGVLGLVYLGLRHAGPLPVLDTMAGPMVRVELERIRSGGPLPYGVAIMFGGAYALLRTLGG